jgi:allophanate hydrolase
VFEHTEHFGDGAAAELFESAVSDAEELATVVSVPEEPFRETAELLYSGPWVAERFAAVGEFIEANPDAVNEVVGEIISEGASYSAVDTFEAMYELQRHKRRVERIFDDIDILLTPTTGTTYTIEDVAASPRETNSNLGHYTDYVNLLDLSAIAVPSGARPDGARLGVTLVGPADDDASLFAFADRLVSADQSSLPIR